MKVLEFSTIRTLWSLLEFVRRERDFFITKNSKICKRTKSHSKWGDWIFSQLYQKLEGTFLNYTCFLDHFWKISFNKNIHMPDRNGINHWNQYAKIFPWSYVHSKNSKKVKRSLLGFYLIRKWELHYNQEWFEYKFFWPRCSSKFVICPQNNMFFLLFLQHN